MRCNCHWCLTRPKGATLAELALNSLKFPFVVFGDHFFSTLLLVCHLPSMGWRAGLTAGAGHHHGCAVGRPRILLCSCSRALSMRAGNRGPHRLTAVRVPGRDKVHGRDCCRYCAVAAAEAPGLIGGQVWTCCCGSLRLRPPRLGKPGEHYDGTHEARVPDALAAGSKAGSRTLCLMRHT